MNVVMFCTLLCLNSFFHMEILRVNESINQPISYSQVYNYTWYWTTPTIALHKYNSTNIIINVLPNADSQYKPGKMKEYLYLVPV